MERLGILYVVLTLIFWGIWGVLGKLAVRSMGAWATYLFGSVPLTIFFILGFLLPRFRPHWTWPAVGWALFAGLVGSIGTFTFYQALVRSQAGAVVTLTALYPAVTVLISLTVLGERLTVPQIIGVILALIAGYLLAR